MYRIVFDPNTSTFVVQVLWLSLFWRACKRYAEGEVEQRKGWYTRLEFETHIEARHWVNSIGLNTAYAEKRVYSTT